MYTYIHASVSSSLALNLETPFKHLTCRFSRPQGVTEEGGKGHNYLKLPPTLLTFIYSAFLFRHSAHPGISRENSPLFPIGILTHVDLCLVRSDLFSLSYEPWNHERKINILSPPPLFLCPSTFPYSSTFYIFPP